MFGNNSSFSMPVVPMGYASNGNNNGSSWGDDWLALAALALIFGWGNGGFGMGGFGMGGFGMNGLSPLMFGGIPFGAYNYGCGDKCATQADVQRAVDQQTLISKIDQQTYGLADSTYALNNAITTGFANAELSRCNQQAALMQQLNANNISVLQGFNGVTAGQNAISNQIASCCCGVERAIDGVNYNMATQSCETRRAISDSTRDIIDNQNCNTRSIIDFLVKDKIDTLQSENQNLKFKASQAEQNALISANQQAQTAELIRRLGADCPVNAYVVQPPTPVTFPTNCCGQFSGYGNYGYGNDCGCGNF